MDSVIVDYGAKITGTDPHVDRGWNWGLILPLVLCLSFWAVALGLVLVISV